MTKPFIQSDKSATSQIETDLLRHCPKALDLWLHFKALSSRLGAISASQQALGEMIPTKVHGKWKPASRSTVNRVVKFLAKRRYIWIGKVGNQNVYILNYNLVWQQAKETTINTLKGYGLTFPTATVLTKDDNRALFDEYHKFKHTGSIDLKKIQPKKSGNGKTTRNGEPIKRRRGSNGQFVSKRVSKIKQARARLAIKRGWTTSLRQCKQLRKEGYRVGYQTSMFKQAHKRGQNKKSAKK